MQSSNKWQQLKQTIANCQLCSLAKTRKNVVFGAGNFNCKLVIVGEAPGQQEDAIGQPFIGRSGQLLTLMLKSINIKRDEIFITNILKCRPTNNRDPQQNEINSCTPYLNQQLAILQPKLIVALGRIAAQFLLKNKQSLANLRSKIHYYNNIPLITTYHPAYLLRAPAQKAKSYQDLLFIQKNLI